jgi:hypothetical protein
VQIVEQTLDNYHMFKVDHWDQRAQNLLTILGLIVINNTRGTCVKPQWTLVIQYNSRSTPKLYTTNRAFLIYINRRT